MSEKDSFDPDFSANSEWAHMYRNHGLQVVPAKTHREDRVSWKRPALSKWRELETTLVPDSTFESWYGEGGTHEHRQNMGLITGACSAGVFVVDLDIHKSQAAQAWWDEMIHSQQKAGELDTVEQETGGGGIQLFFRAPPGWIPPTCKTPIGVDIRGQGGFAMMPPSLHESGNIYWWKKGHEPWIIEFAEAPIWLCDEINKLMREHGGSAYSSGTKQRTSSSSQEKNAFSRITNGREEYMTKMIWAAVVDLYRGHQLKPPAGLSEDEMFKAFRVYERKVGTRIVDPGRTNEQLLEEEGRGITLFRQKWKYAMDQWDHKVREDANTQKNDREPNGDKDTASKTEEGIYFKGIPANEVEPVLSNRWLIKGILPQKGLVIVYGAPGSGKSFFVCDMVAHISAPHIRLWRERKTANGGVAYCFLEGGIGAVNRVAALRSHHGDLGRFYSYPYSMNLSSRPNMSQQQFEQSIEADSFKLVVSIRGQMGTVSVVVVDTLSRAMSGKDENSSVDMTAFISAMDYIAKELDCLVIVVHHAGKDQSKGARGHSSLLAAIDTEMQITRPNLDQPGRKAKVTKMKEGGDGGEFGFELEQYYLGRDEDGDEVTTCLVMPTETDPAQGNFKATRLGPNETVILNVYETFQCDFPDKYTPIGTGFPDKPMKCVDLQQFINFAFGRMVGSEKGARRKVTDAIKTLAEKYIIAINGGLLWRVR